MTPRSPAIHLAYSIMKAFLTTGKREYNLTHRYRDGRWDVYSVEIDGWHILITDGGKVIYANHRANNPAPHHHENVIWLCGATCAIIIGRSTSRRSQNE